ncbi:MAG: MFS transporter [Thermoproteota archaeon]|nr:MFS transporter [Thermoproteota archaeon]
MSETKSETRITKLKNVLPICFAAFFNDTGADMLFAFYPLFFIQVLGISEMKVLGLVDTLALLVGFLVMPFAGRLADIRGRRHLIWSGYALLLISRLSQGLAHIWEHLVPPKMLYQVGRGVRNPPREALLADSVPPRQRGRAFGLLGAMDTLGAIIGPILGIGLFQLFLNLGVQVDDAYRWIFFCAAAPTTISILIIFFGTREVRTDFGESKASRRKWGLTIIRENRPLLLFTLVTCLFTFWNVSENFMLVSGAEILGIGKEQFWISVILYWLINVTFSPTAFFSGRFSDKVGRKIPIIAGMVVLGVMTIGFAFAFNLYTVGVLFMMHGVYQGLFRPSVQAWVADLAPEKRRAEVIGTYKMLTGVSDIPGPFVFGLIWDFSSRKTPFLIGGVFCLICAVLVMLFIPMKKKIT